MFTSELVDDDHVSLISMPSSSNGDENHDDDPPKPTTRGKGCVTRGGAKTAWKGKRRAATKKCPTVESGEEIDLSRADESQESQSEVAEVSGNTSGGRKLRLSKRRQSAVSLSSPKNRKRTRTGSVTQSSTDEASLAQATAAMQVDDTLKGKGKQPVRPVTPSTPRPVPTSQPQDDVPTTGSQNDLPVADHTLDDPILAALTSRHGQESPDADDRHARENLHLNAPGPMIVDDTSSELIPSTSPLSSPPRTPHPKDIIKAASSPPRREAIESFVEPAAVDHGEGSSRSERGMIAGAHPGVLGVGKDGTGRRGKVSKTYGSGTRKSHC